MKDIDFTIVAKYLAGEASEAEQHAVDTWRVSNEKEFRRLSELWTAGGARSAVTDVTFDKAAAWEKTVARLDGEMRNPKSSSSPPRVRQLRYWTMRVAAVLLVIAGTAYLIWSPTTPLDAALRVTAAPGEAPAVLPDGSRVTLREGAALQYRTDFAEERSLVLEGTAFFEVAEDESSPFRIRTDDLRVTVIGTTFYVDAEQSVVGVVSGVVRVEELDGGTDTLRAGQMIRYGRDANGLVGIEPLEQNDLFWKTGVLSFADRPLGEVLTTLREAYGVRIDFDATGSESCRYTGRLKEASADVVLDQLAITLGLKVTEAGPGHFVVLDADCD
ncbi:FecR family protein [Neolewinella xylanilytica]|uniref:FecR family protein n=1 Tax=Neolewinella xylanilytica TaxID=1514080 RepID=A0A2S6I7B9_9BACT|nr:FecR domain-containing protein [Neolewinella xylanilytica]PPK87395.1 FecR family protein [Neolewinella xylanilytica]